MLKLWVFIRKWLEGSRKSGSWAEGKKSESRGAAGVSQTDCSVLTLQWLKTAAGAWCGPGNMINNIRYYLWALVVSPSDSQKQQASLSSCRLHTMAPTLQEQKTTGFLSFFWKALLHLLLCLYASFVCLHLLLYWLRCVRTFGFDSAWMRKHLDKSCFSMTSGCFLHTHAHLGDDSVVCVFRLGLFDVTTERKKRSCWGDHDMANWIRDVSCWCHGRSCPGVFPFPPPRSPSISSSSHRGSVALSFTVDFLL